MYRTLDPEKLLTTIGTFRRRIDRLFPGSGLGEVGSELEQTAQLCIREAERLQLPAWRLRIAVTVGALIILLLPLEVLMLMGYPVTVGGFGELIQVTDAGFNVLLLIAGAVLFLVGMESRMKRNAALKVLHELRSLAHVVDMHQLSKDPGMDPESLDGGPRTNPRPKAIDDADDLWYYLSLSTDLLAVTGKLAALFAQSQTDRTVLDTVNEIEGLSTDLSRKIWQKMSFLKMPTHPPILPSPPES